MKRVLAILLLLPLFALPSFAQYSTFGKNKVQYEKFAWKFIQSDHFDVYYSQDGYDLAVFTAEAAEDAYKSIRKLFRYEITERLVLVVHNSHNEFQQTNVISEYLEEGIGGVTELFKNRVVVPFEGNYRQFRHVIHHELVHAVLNDMFYGGSIQSLITSGTTLILPLWFNEGIAEYSSLGWDKNTDMFMRDAVLHNYLPPIPYLGGYFAYRGGQSVWYYIAVRYGEEKIGEILNRIRGARSIDQGFRSTIGLTVNELSEKWQRELKTWFWPDIARYQDPEDFGRRLTDHTKESNFYNTSPSISPRGDRVAFISDRADYFSIYLMSASDGSNLEQLITGQQTSDFEELHLLTPGIAWSPDGAKIALAVKSGEHDAIMIIDVASGAQERLTFNLDGIFSVDWSPDGTLLAFVGQKSPQSDVYVYNLATKELTQITSDIFSDADPTFAPDSKSIFFSSDRSIYLDATYLPPDFRMIKYDYSQYDLYSVDIATKRVHRVVGDEESDETSPVMSADGKTLLYISNRNGINNIYARNLETGADRPLTNSLSGLYQLSSSADGSKLVFSTMTGGGFDIFSLLNPLQQRLSLTTLEPTRYAKKLVNAETPRADTNRVSRPSPNDTVSVRDRVTFLADTTHQESKYQTGNRVDYSDFVFSDENMRDAAEPSNKSPDFAIRGNVDAEGNYVPRKYKLSFSPDLVYGSASYNTFYGIEASTLMAFSDMMGDHQIVLQADLMFDLKNSNYGLSYFYLPNRIDWGFIGYHSARFLYVFDPEVGPTYYRFRQWAVGLSMSYPIDRFRRIDLSLFYMNLSKDNLDYVFVRPERRGFILPMFSYVHDNSLWQGGWFGPTNGSRFNLTVYGAPKFSNEMLDIWTVTFDWRRYTKIFRELILVSRFSGGSSFGKDRQEFLLGGDAGWINRRIEGLGFPVDDVADYAFLTPVYPMRGYPFNRLHGAQYGLANFEFRFPLVRYFILGALPFGFQNILGSAFLDVGSAWNNTEKWRAFSRGPAGDTQTRDLLVGTGFGARLIFFGIPLRVDVAWSYHGSGFSRPAYYFSIGPEI
jgi:Tol biopolymer transport system component